MERQSSNRVEKLEVKNFNPDEKYELAYKRVKRIKGFYIHTLVYVLVNAFVIISSYSESKMGLNYFITAETYAMGLFWGIGLLAHGLSVFGRNLFFATEWEERKIKEFMDKDKTQNWE
jgi:hypothetical protein